MVNWLSGTDLVRGLLFGVRISSPTRRKLQTSVFLQELVVVRCKYQCRPRDYICFCHNANLQSQTSYLAIDMEGKSCVPASFSECLKLRGILKPHLIIALFLCIERG